MIPARRTVRKKIEEIVGRHQYYIQKAIAEDPNAWEWALDEELDAMVEEIVEYVMRLLEGRL